MNGAEAGFFIRADPPRGYPPATLGSAEGWKFFLGSFPGQFFWNPIFGSPRDPAPPGGWYLRPPLGGSQPDPPPGLKKKPGAMRLRPPRPSVPLPSSSPRPAPPSLPSPPTSAAICPRSLLPLQCPSPAQGGGRPTKKIKTNINKQLEKTKSINWNVFHFSTTFVFKFHFHSKILLQLVYNCL